MKTGSWKHHIEPVFYNSRTIYIQFTNRALKNNIFHVKFNQAG